jgi:PAS domain S-box-containing protein
MANMFDLIMEQEGVCSESSLEDCRAVKNYLKTIIDTSTDGIFVIDKEGNFEFGNNASFDILGWPKSELIGVSFLKVIALEYHDFILKRWEEVQKGEGKPYDVVIAAKNGERRNLLVSHKDMEIGGQRKYCVVVKDITDHVKSEEEIKKLNRDLERRVMERTFELEDQIKARNKIENDLRESEMRYRTIVENSNDLIWMLDTKGSFTYFNKRCEELAGGHKLTDEIGKSFMNLILPDDLPKVRKVFLETISGTSQHYTVRTRDYKGGILTLSVDTSPIVKDGKAVGTISFAHNIAE